MQSEKDLALHLLQGAPESRLTVLPMDLTPFNQLWQNNGIREEKNEKEKKNRLKISVTIDYKKKNVDDAKLTFSSIFRKHPSLSINIK